MRSLLLSFSCVLVCFASCVIGSSALAENRPNFVLIMADDLGYGDIGCYGNKQIQTPNIDALAARGVLFTDYHSNGAVCSPTRAALVTGRYQQRSGVSGVITAANHRETGLAISEVTFADLFAQHGYATALIGKWHLGYKPELNPVHNGFQLFRGYVSGNVDFFSHIDQVGKLDWWNQDQIQDEPGYTTHLITRHATDFIKSHSQKPFCLYVAHEAPHYPYQGPNDQPIRSLENPGRVQGERKDIANAYREMIEELDKGVGQITTTLKDLDLLDNTMIILCSDNGANKNGSNGNWRGFKGQIWEGGHRVPAIVSWPRVVPENVTSSATALSMDWFPTMLAAAMIDIPTELKLDGQNLIPIIKSKTSTNERAVFWSVGGAMAARRGDWKLVVENKAKGASESKLFNLSDDPAEKSPISNPAVEQELTSELETWKASWKDIPQKS